MSIIDLGVIGVALLGLAVWVRGCVRAALGDCWLGLLIGLVACALYFGLFSLTRTAWFAGMIMGSFILVLILFRRRFRSRSGQVLIGCLVLFTTATIVVEHKLVGTGNALLVIEPYRVGRGWAFDAPRLGLKQEPFVNGIPEMIDKLVVGIPGAETSVRLIFSQRRFPGAQLELQRRREQDGGNWYYSSAYNLEGWLCPALFRYFPRAPQRIYVKAEPK